MNENAVLKRKTVAAHSLRAHKGSAELRPATERRRAQHAIAVVPHRVDTARDTETGIQSHAGRAALGGAQPRVVAAHPSELAPDLRTRPAILLRSRGPARLRMVSVTQCENAPVLPVSGIAKLEWRLV